MKIILTLIVVLWLASPVAAQRYNTALGARIDRDMLGITVKQRFFRTVAAEGIIAGNNEAMIGTVLLEKHYPIAGRGLSAYMGGGAHVGGAESGGTILGPDIILGAEFKLPFMPLLVSADIKPAYHFRTASDEEDDISRFDFSTAISVRYVIGKERSEDRQRYRKHKRKRRDRSKEKVSKVKDREKAKRTKIKQKSKDKRDKEREKTRALRNKKNNRNGNTPVGEWKVFTPFKKLGRGIKGLFNKDE